MKFAPTLSLLFLAFFNALAQAQLPPQAENDVANIGIGTVQHIATRDGVTVPLYTYWRDDALATVVLFSGGGGGYGPIGDDGWPGSGNFLIRTGKRWASHRFNVVMVGRPSDRIDLSMGQVRTGAKHASDNAAILQSVRRQSPLPIWVVGTSMGTISAAAVAIADRDRLVAGVVLTSSIVSYKVPGAVPKQSLAGIRVPALIFHHEQDACWACRPDEVRSLEAVLINAPIKKTIFASGGEGATGDPCEPQHHHGFVGMQDAAVDRIAQWLLTPTP